ncbi:MAG: nitrous oxide reductase family maturation protein NosD [Candidatus Thorarchaeota archaeon]
MVQLAHVPVLLNENQMSITLPNWCLNDATPHSQITISGNSDFVSQGWPGNGTESSPFIIENLSIFANQTCINITDTDAFFIVKDCVLDADVYEMMPRQFCVYFRNVTNGKIVDSMLSSRADAIFIDDSDFCQVDRCDITAQWNGLHTTNCTFFILSNSRVSSLHTWELYTEDTDQLVVLSNEMIGGYNAHGGLLVSGSIGFEIRNNTIQNHEDEGLTIGSSFNGLIVNNSISENYFGMELWSAENTIVTNNSVYDNYLGFNLWSDEKNCTLETNSIHHNEYGLWIAGDNNRISRNSFLANEFEHANDAGQGNIWIGNWWDDYIGYGWYPIAGVAGSYDSDPEPKNMPLLVATSSSILLIISGCVVFSVILVKRARRSHPLEPNIIDWDTKERFVVPLLLFMLLPSAIHFYLPAFNPARWSIWVSTSFGVLSWTAHPSWGHFPLEFSFPWTISLSITLHYIVFGLVWFILSAIVVRRFWLFISGDISRSEVLRTIAAILVIMGIIALVTMTIPIPLLPLAALVQVSRFRK